MKPILQFRLFKLFLFFIIGLISLSGYAQNSATEGKDFYVSFGGNSVTPICQIRYVITKTTRITAQYGDGTYMINDKGAAENNTLYLPGVYTQTVDMTKCCITGATNASTDANRRLRIISADEKIGVFAINLAANSTDATTVLPTTAYGSNYTILSHTVIAIARLLIIAPEQGANITIKNKGGGIILNNYALPAGKVYHYNGGGTDLTGFKVESNNPVAVFSTLDCGQQVSNGACDTNYEQMWPADTAGKDFFLWNMSPQFPNTANANTRDKINILALDDGTVITKKIGAAETTINLNKNQVNSFFLDTAVHKNNSLAPVKLTSNKPILVENILGFAPCIKWISSTEQRITSAVIAPFIPAGTSVIERHQLHLMIPAGTENQTTIKETRGGVATNVTLKYYTNTSDPKFVIATKEYGKTDQVFIEINNEAGFIAYMGGYGGYESYIFTAGAGAFNLQAYYTVGTKTNPYKDTYYSGTSTMTHTFDEMDDITIKRTLEKAFTSIKWLLNGTQYTVTENLQPDKSWLLPASALQKGENTLTMSVRYTGATADSLYVGKVWLSNISSYPDNIDDPTCSVINNGTNWSITESLPMNMTDMAHNYGPLVSGDIDGDGKVEIIGLLPDDRTSNWFESGGIIIYNYEDGVVKKKHSFLTEATTPSFGSMAIARYNNKGHIVFVGADRHLYAYAPDGTKIWKSDKVCGPTYSNLVNIADFNNDGIPEIYVGNKIFSLDTGFWLCDGGANNIGIMSSTTGSSPMAIDIDNDPERTLELVAGTQIYKVTIPQGGTTSAGCSMGLIDELEMKKPLPSGAIKDGITQVVDIDNDGALEVVVSSFSAGRVVVYVWKPLPGGESYIMGHYLVPTAGTSYNSVPMIGDIDKDGYHEIVFITKSHMYALDYIPNLSAGENALKFKWNLGHTDASECTGMTLFDFDLDGTAEIVYRDQTTLRIIDGSGVSPIAKETFNNVKSGTLREYPIIADIDGDGQAEIIVTGHPTITFAQNAPVRVFKSGGSRWASARPVWNQYNYNAVNVNEDLTIPAVQFPITTKFKGKDEVANTVDDVRIFNNFRQQQTYLDRNGIPYLPVPDIKVVDAGSIQFNYNASENKLYVSNLKVKNEGQAATNVPLWITTYHNNVSATNSKKDIYKYDNPSSIAVNETRVIDFTINNFSNWMPVNKLIIKVNDSGNGLNNQPVCDSCCINNESGSFVNVNFEELAWANKYRHCEKGTVNFDAKILPGTNVEYKWFRPSNAATAFSSQRNPQLTNLALADGGQFTFTANKVNGNLSVTYKLPYLSVAPQVMQWKNNTTNNDWNDPNNWNQVNPTTGVVTPIKAVPAECTTVHIPAAATNYPSLSQTAGAGITATDWSLYGQPGVENIIYHYGAEVAYPHQLQYNKAYIQYNFGYYTTYTAGQPTQNKEPGSPVLKRDVWYPMAAPLKEMVSGDFAFGGYPVTWQAMPDILSSSNNLNSVNFNKYHAKNDQPLAGTNNMIALKAPLWSSAKGSSDQKHIENLKGILEIPFHENDAQAADHPSHSYDPISNVSTYYYYDSQTLQQVGSPVGTQKRKNDNAYRFIFEKDDKTVTNVTINGVSVPCYTMEVTPNASKQVLIGNPFIASINMDHFQKANSTVIEGTTFNAYKSDEKNWKPYTYSASSVNALQAFAITLRTTAKITLNFPLEGNWALTGKAGSKIPRRLETPGAIAVTASNTAGKGGDYAELTAGQEQAVNVSKLISEEGHALPEAFFIDQTGNDYNLIQIYEQGMNEVGLGVKCSDTQNELTLTFDHIEAFSQLNNTHPVLVDKLLGVEQDLTQNSVYRFRQHTTANSQSQYADKKRFAIRFGDGSDTGSADDSMQVIYTNSHLEVKTTVAATQVEVYSLSGQLLFNSGAIATINYHQDLPLAQGGYIVKVKTDNNKTTSKKIMAL